MFRFLAITLWAGMYLPGFSQTSEKPFGSYLYEDDKITLTLSPPNNYTLFGTEYSRRTGMVSSKEISRGTFEMEEEQLVLEEYPTRNQMTLHMDSEVILEALDVKEIDKGEMLYARTVEYENGQPRMEGEWKRGKKHGTWIYYDEEGNVVKSEKYRRGKLID
ncbi:toxin-antitoxin system YwqK family antitoxin [Catalinimonas niigatensis]|uniref:toxin-antitoxin system YwqK family antitoxin n=1 Tax=Catalinimonas niigatensis TaxID=1397264 RepID=UPI002666E73E|nr:hypothetical protein [Catalinimonas niigatensis]WPP48573.1 hypothetical protein PZB72_18035 [Catalinimonas niigatensis]